MSDYEHVARALGIKENAVEELVHFSKNNTYASSFSAAEVLRRRGLATRHSTHTAGWDYADFEGVHEQSRYKHVKHEWYLTDIGAALAQFIKENV